MESLLSKLSFLLDHRRDIPHKFTIKALTFYCDYQCLMHDFKRLSRRTKKMCVPICT